MMMRIHQCSLSGARISLCRCISDRRAQSVPPEVRGPVTVAVAPVMMVPFGYCLLLLLAVSRPFASTFTTSYPPLQGS